MRENGVAVGRVLGVATAVAEALGRVIGLVLTGFAGGTGVTL